MEEMIGASGERSPAGGAFAGSIMMERSCKGAGVPREEEEQLLTTSSVKTQQKYCSNVEDDY